MTDRESNPMAGGCLPERSNPARSTEPRAATCACEAQRPESPPCRLRASDRDEAPDATDHCDGPATGVTARISMSELIDRIVHVHHGRLRHELPRLLKLADDVADAYGCQNPVLGEVREVLRALKEDLDTHMIKEEWVVFPKIMTWESACTGTCCLEAPDGSFTPLEIEHQRAAATLARLRALTGGVSTRLNGCATYRVLTEGLATLELDLQEHVHDENDLLFPRACVSAALLRARSTVGEDPLAESRTQDVAPAGRPR